MTAKEQLERLLENFDAKILEATNQANTLQGMLVGMRRCRDEVNGQLKKLEEEASTKKKSTRAFKG